MKYLFAAIIASLTLLSIIMARLKPAPPDSAKVPLVWVSDNNPERVPQIEAFNQLYPDCWLRLDPNNTGVTKVIVQSCAGVGPDIIDVYGIQQLQTYVDAGVLLDVTERARKMGFSPDVTYPKAAPALQIEGRQYSFPCNVNVRIVFYNRNIFDRYHVPYPPRHCSWDEMVKIAKRVTIRRPGSTLPECFGIANVYWNELVYQAGGRFFNETGTRCTIDSPTCVRAVQFYHDLMFKHHVMPTPLERSSMSGQGGWGQGWRNWFGSQKIAMIVIGKWALITFRRFVQEQQAEYRQWQLAHPGEPYEGYAPLNMGACLMPWFPEEPMRLIISCRSAAVNRLSLHSDSAVKFLQFLTTKEYCDSINRGADALPGNRRYGTLEAMHNDDYPNEDIINELTLESTQWGVVREISPFIDGETTLRLIGIQIQRLEAGTDVPVSELMAQAAHDVNEQIRKNVIKDPQLKQRFLAAGGKL